MKLQVCQCPAGMDKHLMNIKEMEGLDDRCPREAETSIYLHRAEMGPCQTDEGIGSGMKQMAGK